jgi:hypothetical protein
VAQKLFRRGGGRRLGEGAADIHAGMVVGAADADTAMRLDVEDSGHVQLGRPRPVARLPGAEQLREPAAVALAEGRPDVVEGVRQRAGDPVLVKVGGAGLEVAGVGLQPLMVSEIDPVTEDVHRLGLAGEAGGQLLGDEAIRAIGKREAAVDRVVVGDRHEVHAASLGEVVDLLRRGRALRQSERALHPEARELRGGRVAVHVHAGSHRRLPLLSVLQSPDCANSRENL